MKIKGNMLNYQNIYFSAINEKRKSLLLLLIRAVLRFLSYIYYFIIQLRIFLFRVNILQRRRLNAYVISVGNITLGGTGKTPFVLWLANVLKEKGKKVAVLSRGYKGKLKGKIGVASDGKNILLEPKECGDEAYLLARNLPNGIPVIVGKNRFLSGSYAIDKFKVDTVILDDGFQHLKLFRDLDIVLINAKNPLGNGYSFPRGMLREPLKSIKRGNILVFTKCDNGVDEDALREILKIWGRNKLICKSIYKPVSFVNIESKAELDLDLIRDKKILALCSIADPLTFKNMLNKLGAKEVWNLSFPDHYDYKQKDINKIISYAKEVQGEIIITTEKDAVRLESIWKEEMDLYYLKMEMRVSDEHPFFNLSR